MGDELTADIRQFLRGAIRSVAELELVLLLHADPARRWTANEVRLALYVSDDEAAAAQLRALADRGLLGRAAAAEPTFHFQPASEETRALVARVKELYERRRVAVVQAIYFLIAYFWRFDDALRAQRNARDFLDDQYRNQRQCGGDDG